ncbi:hypothetical protein [Ideonella livida]|uniref:Gp5/Type VI secretion system Vgr protein OB-fold domain-containing protein n=1 Tax=Ideonella livida TaxID=2707176 RepID=A0A7C9TGK4_9BURK|nr:hypothetical protein [Ideonella livida]NDY89700.1 hypothetical protein [Ideonella livida]
MTSPAHLERWTPGEIASVDQVRRVVRVRIPGITDGAEVYPEADLCYPLGERPDLSEIRLMPGDPVWLDFVRGNPKYPVVIGYRCPQAGNAQGVRRVQHDQIEMKADSALLVEAVGGGLLIKAGTRIKLAAPNLEIDGDAVFRGGVTLERLVTVLQGLQVTGGQVKHLGQDIGATHTHGTPSGPSTPPVP